MPYNDTLSKIKAEVRMVNKLLSVLVPGKNEEKLEQIKDHVSLVTKLLLQVGTLDISEVSWTADWGELDFSNLGGQTVAQHQAEIEGFISDWLAAQDVRDGTNHSITAINWNQANNNPLKYTVDVFLNPSAVRTTGGPGGSISPTPPPKT